ncbi:MAG: membrane protein insertase YidC [candidate division FCPU426 bacterium]
MDKRFVIFIIISVAVLYFSNYYAMQKAKQKISTSHINITEKTTKPESDEIEKILKISDEKALVESNEKGSDYQFENNFLKMSANSKGILKEVLLKTAPNNEELIAFIKPNEQNDNFNFEYAVNEENVNDKKEHWDFNRGTENFTLELKKKEQYQIAKKISFFNNQTAKVEIKIGNLSKNVIELKTPKLIWQLVKERSSPQNIKQIVIYSKAKVLRIKPQKKSGIEKVDYTPEWLGIKDQYFCMIFYKSNPQFSSAIVKYSEDQSMSLYIVFPNIELMPGETKVIEMHAYLGPQNYENLKKIGYQLQHVVHFGFFHIIGVPLYYLLKFFYSITKNYGFAIILLTILIRVILWWPTQKSYSSMKKMQTAMNKMQPRLKTLKEIYKNEPAKLNEETMKLYREYQINPMGGCLPMLLQMPVFFALYSTLVSSVELKGAPFIWFWKDLSLKDPYYVLPLLMGISMFIQQKMSTPPAATPEAAAQQKMMLYFMPAMLTFFAFVWPSGLLLYWVVSNILSIGQQLLINRSR